MFWRPADGLSAKTHSVFRGLVLALLSGIFFSLVSVIVKDLKHLHPGQLALYRFMAIFATSIPQSVQIGQNLFGPKKFRFYLLLRGCFGGFNLFFTFLSIQYLSLSEATAIIFSVPVFVTVGARIFLQEPCSIFQSITVLLTVTGIVFTTKLPSRLTEEPVVYTHEKLYGLLGAIIAVICSTFQILLVRKMKSVHQAILMFNYGWVTITETLILTALFGNFSFHQCGMQAVYIILLGLFSYAGQALMILGLQCDLAGPVTTVKSASDIILAFFWQIFIFQDYPDSYSIIGASLVGFSVVCIGFEKWFSTRSSGLNLIK